MRTLCRRELCLAFRGGAERGGALVPRQLGPESPERVGAPANERPVRLHAVGTPIDLGRPSQGPSPPAAMLRVEPGTNKHAPPSPLKSRRASTAIYWESNLSSLDDRRVGPPLRLGVSFWSGQVHCELVPEFPERVAAGPPRRRAPGRHEQPKTARAGRGNRIHRLREPSQAAQGPSSPPSQAGTRMQCGGVRPNASPHHVSSS